LRANLESSTRGRGTPRSCSFFIARDRSHPFSQRAVVLLRRTNTRTVCFDWRSLEKDRRTDAGHRQLRLVKSPARLQNKNAATPHLHRQAWLSNAQLRRSSAQARRPASVCHGSLPPTRGSLGGSRHPRSFRIAGRGSSCSTASSARST